MEVPQGIHGKIIWDSPSNPQGEGGEQGDALMPLLFAVGQHQALVAAHRQLQNNESIFVFLDDIYMVTTPERVGAVCAIVQEELRVHACIRIRTRKQWCGRIGQG